MKGFIFVVVVLTLLGIFSFFPILEKGDNYLSPKTQKNSTLKPSFPEVSLLAKSAVVYDVLSGEILYAKEPLIQLPLASLTKIMTVAVTLDTLSPGVSIPVSKEALQKEGDSGLKARSFYNLEELASFTLTSSSNDGAAALAAAALYSLKEPVSLPGLLNQRAENLGLFSSFFINETGLDESASLSGAYGSALDVASLLSDAVSKYPEVFEATTKKDIKIPGDTAGRLSQNTNPYAHSVSGILASKTGFTDLSGGNLAIIFDAGLLHPIALVALSSSEEGRFEDIRKLEEATRLYLAELP